MAWVAGVEHMTLPPKAGGDPIKLDVYSTHVFRNFGLGWLMVVRHAQQGPK